MGFLGGMNAERQGLRSRKVGSREDFEGNLQCVEIVGVWMWWLGLRLRYVDGVVGKTC